MLSQLLVPSPSAMAPVHHHRQFKRVSSSSTTPSSNHSESLDSMDERDGKPTSRSFTDILADLPPSYTSSLPEASPKTTDAYLSTGARQSYKPPALELCVGKRGTRGRESLRGTASPFIPAALLPCGRKDTPNTDIKDANPIERNVRGSRTSSAATVWTLNGEGEKGEQERPRSPARKVVKAIALVLATLSLVAVFIVFYAWMAGAFSSAGLGVLANGGSHADAGGMGD